MIRPFQKSAERFLVWREGSAVSWRCTYQELAATTGLSVTRVKAICKQAGYTLIDTEPDTEEMDLVDLIRS